MNCQDHLYRGMKPKEVARRWFLEQCGVGLGAIALSHLLGETGLAAPNTPPADPMAPKKPHFAPKAKRVIFLFMAGAPSHLELFDYKPQLAKFDGTRPPADLLPAPGPGDRPAVHALRPARVPGLPPARAGRLTLRHVRAGGQPYHSRGAHAVQLPRRRAYETGVAARRLRAGARRSGRPRSRPPGGGGGARGTGARGGGCGRGLAVRPQVD